MQLCFKDTYFYISEDALQSYESYLDWKSAAFKCVDSVGGPLVNLERVPFNWTLWDKLKISMVDGDKYWTGGYYSFSPFYWIFGRYHFIFCKT